MKLLDETDQLVNRFRWMRLTTRLACSTSSKLLVLELRHLDIDMKYSNCLLSEKVVALLNKHLSRRSEEKQREITKEPRNGFFRCRVLWVCITIVVNLNA